MSDNVKNTSVNNYSGIKANASLGTVSSSYGSVASKIVGMKEVEIEEIDFDVEKAQSSLDVINGIAYHSQLVDDLKNTASTICVGYTTIMSGILKIGEHLSDGAQWLDSAIVSTVFDFVGLEDLSLKIKEKAQDEIARDKVGELNQYIYENTTLGKIINENSSLKYDSQLSQNIQNITAKISEVVAATGVTVATGGLAAPAAFTSVFGLGFVEGVGESSEKRYQDSTADDYQTAAIMLDGIGTGFNWYSFGKLGQGGLQLGKVASELGLKNTVKTFTNLAKSFVKNFSLNDVLNKEFLTKVLKSGIVDIDNLVDSGGIIVDNITDYVNGEKLDLKTMFKELAFAYGLNCVFDGFSNLLNDQVKAMTLFNTAESSISNKQISELGEDVIANTDGVLERPNLQKKFECYSRFGIGRRGVNQNIVSEIFERVMGTQHTDDILAVINNYFPGISEMDAIKLAKSMNTSSGGLCDYAAMLNCVRDYFQNNNLLDLFEEKFGYSLFKTTADGSIIANDQLLLADLFCYLNQNNTVQLEDGVWKFVGGYKNKIDHAYYATSNFKIIEDWLSSKGVDAKIETTPIFNNCGVIPWQYKADLEKENLGDYLFNSFEASCLNDNVVLKLFPSKTVFMPCLDFNNSFICNGNHDVTVIGIHDKDNLIVSSWGFRCLLNIVYLKQIEFSAYQVSIK